MYINALAATFGRLEHEKLELGPGLNIMEAPNEGGKSTWSAFVRVMFYGLSTRDRSAAADKRRYLPWSGSAMEGSMDITSGGRDITIIRRTTRANSPMGTFSAVYTGTSQPAEGLTAAGCGESLLGVPQEVFERSAFIRQAGVALDHNAALEQRITSLISTGEEDTSFTAAWEQLKRQLNARRYNKSGRLPQLEREMESLRSALGELEGLDRQLEGDRAALEALEARIGALEQSLAQHGAADRYEAFQAFQRAQEALEAAQKQLANLAQRTRGLPSREELARLRSALDALEPADRAVREAEDQLRAARDTLTQAQTALASHPLAGQTPAQAESAPLGGGARPRLPLWILPVALSAGAGAALALYALHPSLPAVLGGGAAAAALAFLAGGLLTARRQRRWEAEQAQRRQERQAEVTAYTLLYAAEARARTACGESSAVQGALRASYETNLAHVLEQVRRFQPVDGPGEARQAVQEALDRWDHLEAARREAEALALRRDLTQRPEHPAPPAHRPRESRDSLQAQLRAAEEERAQLQARLHTAQGRLQGLGDPGELATQLAESEERLALLQGEYDAIALAMEALTAANTELQSRFSPALGEMSGRIFTKLTRGRYNKVLLNREMLPSAQESGQSLPREAAALSQGAADQLYLAVRLAICQLVLPAEKEVPILLDDALTSFDDDRMAAALDYLVELSAQRQILLLTCQRREGAYLAQAHPGAFRLLHPSN